MCWAPFLSLLHVISFNPHSNSVKLLILFFRCGKNFSDL